LIFGSFHQGKEQRSLLLESIHTPSPNSRLRKKLLFLMHFTSALKNKKKEQPVKLQKLNIE